jgi:hypothetical protein
MSTVTAIMPRIIRRRERPAKERAYAIDRLEKVWAKLYTAQAYIENMQDRADLLEEIGPEEILTDLELRLDAMITDVLVFRDTLK